MVYLKHLSDQTSLIMFSVVEMRMALVVQNTIENNLFFRNYKY